jgi:hypothetical protein
MYEMYTLAVDPDHSDRMSVRTDRHAGACPHPAGGDARPNKGHSRGGHRRPRRLRQSETVKAYGMNRYIDVADARVMHERHAVYRLEQQPAWITRSPKNQTEMILGPIVGLHKPEYAAEPLPGETSREIFQARRGIQEANEGMNDLRESQVKLTNDVEAMAKNTAEAERKLTVVISVLNERVKHLEGGSSAAGDDPPQAKTAQPGEGGGEVIVRSPNP